MMLMSLAQCSEAAEGHSPGDVLCTVQCLGGSNHGNNFSRTVVGGALAFCNQKRYCPVD